MGNFDLFRRKTQIAACCAVKYRSDFIENGTSSITIYHVRRSADKSAALIITDKEGPDTSLVYTYKDTNSTNELLKGDYFIWQNKYYFVFEDVSIVRDTGYKKQKAYQCNVNFEINKQTYWAYYVSSLAGYVGEGFQAKISIADSEKPILIVPHQDWVKLGTTIVINGKPWKIIDIDFTTNHCIDYCSLELDFIQKNAEELCDCDCEDCEICGDCDDCKIKYPNKDENTIHCGQEITLSTEDGYFVCEEADIIKRSSNEVIFIIPFGIKEVEIKIKKDAEIISTKYKVVI